MKTLKDFDFMIRDLPTASRDQRLSISRDYEDSPYDEIGVFPVLLYVPNTAKHDHKHIILTDETVRILHEWTGQYLAERGNYGKGHRPPDDDTGPKGV